MSKNSIKNKYTKTYKNLIKTSLSEPLFQLEFEDCLDSSKKEGGRVIHMVTTNANFVLLFIMLIPQMSVTMKSLHTKCSAQNGIILKVSQRLIHLSSTAINNHQPLP